MANRYFGVFQDGSLKIRGIEARRGDTPPFIAWLQMQILQQLAAAPDLDAVPARLPAIAVFLRQQYHRLRAGAAPIQDLLVAQKLSRAPGTYRRPSPAARAALQLHTLRGVSLRPGQTMRFLFIRGGKPAVHAWDSPFPPRPEQLDLDYYGKLFRRACLTVLQPFGMVAETLDRCLTEPEYRLDEQAAPSYIYRLLDDTPPHKISSAVPSPPPCARSSTIGMKE